MAEFGRERPTKVENLKRDYKEGELQMNRYSKMLLLVLLASATALFVCGITGGQAYAAFQDEADEDEVG